VDVEYDNGERETVLGENVSPLDVPVAFGGETVPLQARAARACSLHACAFLHSRLSPNALLTFMHGHALS
jgi:hypothetical protein